MDSRAGRQQSIANNEGGSELFDRFREEHVDRAGLVDGPMVDFIEPRSVQKANSYQFGDRYGVPNLGPLTTPKSVNFSTASGGQSAIQIPGGLEGKFTYYDLLWLKSKGYGPELNPTQKQFSLNRVAFRKQIPISFSGSVMR